MDKIVGKVKKQIEKAKIKRYIKKLIEILSLKELRILPAYLAYSFVLALIPILTIIVIVAGFFSISIDSVISLLTDLLPSYASRVVVDAISGQSFDFSVGFLNIVTFCIAANGMYAIISASNSLYKIEETNMIKDRLRSVRILLVIIILLLFLILVPMLGEQILELLRNSKPFTGIIDEIIMVYNIIKWPITFIIIFLNIKLIYQIAPSKEIKSEETTIGAFITTLGWVVFTAFFGYYIKYFGRYDLVYGGLSSIIILLIWVYTLCFILILGIVINTMKYNKS